jgi:glutamate synthase domain-containing protein 2
VRTASLRPATPPSSTPIELCEFLGLLRAQSGGKLVGFKICIGQPREFFAICKAMIATEIRPDFITVDGGEGGTGAARQEYSDHLGMPLREGLIIVNNCLVSLGIRDQVRVAASGRLAASYQIAAAMALGVDWCNIARGFMFAVGCIQSQSCHTNKCPVGVATQDARLQRGLVVEDKALRVRNSHHNTVQGLAEMTAACGLEHPNEFRPDQIFERIEPNQVRPLSTVYDFLEADQLLAGDAGPLLQHAWDTASASSFAPS